MAIKSFTALTTRHEFVTTLAPELGRSKTRFEEKTSKLMTQKNVNFEHNIHLRRHYWPALLIDDYWQ